MKVNNWIDVSTPPDLKESDCLDWLRSVDVLVFDGISQRIAKYEKIDDSPCTWHSSCSERWELLGIKCWMPLPNNPETIN